MPMAWFDGNQHVLNSKTPFFASTFFSSGWLDIERRSSSIVRQASAVVHWRNAEAIREKFLIEFQCLHQFYASKITQTQTHFHSIFDSVELFTVWQMFAISMLFESIEWNGLDDCCRKFIFMYLCPWLKNKRIIFVFQLTHHNASLPLLEIYLICTTIIFSLVNESKDWLSSTLVH